MDPNEIDRIIKPLLMPDLRTELRSRGCTPAGELNTLRERLKVIALHCSIKSTVQVIWCLSTVRWRFYSDRDSHIAFFATQENMLQTGNFRLNAGVAQAVGEFQLSSESCSSSESITNI